METLLGQVRAQIYTPVAPLEITAWQTAEPVSFADRECGERSTVAPGQTWGRRLFDCAWMRFRATVPSPVTGPLVARIDINDELCVVDACGTPVRGLTNVKSTFDETLGGPAKTIYQLPPAVINGNRVEFWADCGLNDLFGFIKENGVIALAEVATCREDLRQLYYDLETLHDFQKGLPEGDELRHALASDIQWLSANLDGADPASVEQARARLRPWFHSTDKDRLLVHAIGHAHLDLAWLWPIRETIRKGARTFATALYNIERYPGYIFGCSQPQLYAWMKEAYPALYTKIKAAVHAGRIEPQGTFWVEPDCNMPSGEALVRQILLGSTFFREEFGVVPDYCWEPDVFGYNGQLPQILNMSGHHYFMTQKLSWNVVNRFPHQSFRWEGIDGTAILTHMLPEETYNSPAAARSLRKIAASYAERAVSAHALMVFGIGDGGGGPDAEHLERLRRAPGLPGLPAVAIEPASSFFKSWCREAERFPVWKGELYLERHQGTLTTQAAIKRYNRRCEVALREAEWAAFLATHQAGVAYPTAALDRLWKEVLLYQFHDILPGSSIKRVYEECGERYERILDELTRLARDSYAAVASRCPAASGLVAFNSLSWPRQDWLKVEGTWRHISVPALGWTAVPPPSPYTPPSASVGRLENDRLRVEFAADGRLCSLYDKLAQREVIATDAFANDFVVMPDLGDAWDFETDHPNKDVCCYLRQPIRRPHLVSQAASVDGPCAMMEQAWRIGASEIRQTIRLLAGADEIAFDTQVDWREPATMLRVRFPVAIQSDQARFEIPFGSIHRSTQEDTPHRLAQIEVAALQWVDLAQDDYGVALYNDCKYGFRIKGHTIDMSLIRSVPYPGAALVGRDDKAGPGAAAVYGDLGQHTFSYVLKPHSGRGTLADITAGARRLNTPLALVPAGAAPGKLLPEVAFSLDSPCIEVAAIKPSGSGWALRLVNVEGHEGAARLKTVGLSSPWVECDLLERPLARGESSESLQGPGTHLVFHPFEIKTCVNSL